MAQNQFINAKVRVTQADGTVDPQFQHASASAQDLTFSWDSAKLPNRRSLTDALQKLLVNIHSRGDIPQ